MTDPRHSQQPYGQQPYGQQGPPPPPPGYAQPYAAPAPPPAPKRGKSRWLIPLGTLILGIIIGSASHGSSTPAATTASGSTVTVTTAGGAKTVTQPAAAAPSQKPAAAAAPGDTIPGDGSFLVGTDVKPGTYRSGTPSSGNCYWARAKGDQITDIFANNNSKGPSVVTIKSTDKIFKSQGCEDWVKVK